MESSPIVVRENIVVDADWHYIDSPVGTPTIPTATTPRLPAETPHMTPPARAFEPSAAAAAAPEGLPVTATGLSGPAEVGMLGLTASTNLVMAGIVGLGAGALLMRWWSKQTAGAASPQSTAPTHMHGRPELLGKPAPDSATLPTVQGQPEPVAALKDGTHSSGAQGLPFLAGSTSPESVTSMNAQGVTTTQSAGALNAQGHPEPASMISPSITSTSSAKESPELGISPAKLRQASLDDAIKFVPPQLPTLDERPAREATKIVGASVAEAPILLGTACQHLGKDAGQEAEAAHAGHDDARKDRDRQPPGVPKVQKEAHAAQALQRAERTGTAKQALAAVGVVLAFMLVANQGLMLRRLQSAAPISVAHPSMAEAQRAPLRQLEKVSAIPGVRREPQQPPRPLAALPGAPKRCAGFGQDTAHRRSPDVGLASVDVEFEIMAAAAAGPRGPIGHQAAVDIVGGIVRPPPQSSSSRIFRLLPSQ